MSTRNIFICCVVCFILGAAVCWFAQSGQRQAGDTAIVEAENMARVVAGIGTLIEEQQNYRSRIDDSIAAIESNFSAAGRILESITIELHERAVRDREIESKFGELGVELSTATGGVRNVADELDQIINGAESGEVETSD